MHVGIAEREWIRGEVAEVSAGRISVRIDDPGRYPHTLNGVVVTKGQLIPDSPLAWVPCL